MFKITASFMFISKKNIDGVIHLFPTLSLHIAPHCAAVKEV